MLNKYINCIMFIEGNSGICGQTPWGRILFHQCSCICMCGYEYVSMSMCMLSKGFCCERNVLFTFPLLMSFPENLLFLFTERQRAWPEWDKRRERERERHSKHLKPSQSWETMQKHYGCRFVCVRLCFGDVCMCVWVCKTAVVHPKWHIPIKSSHWFDSGVCKVVFCVCVCAHQARGETNFSPWFWCLLLCDVLYINNMFL